MKRKIKYIVIGVIVVVVGFVYAHVDKPNYIYDSHTDNSAYTTFVLKNGETVRQSFRCTDNKIDGISVKIAVNSSSPESRLHYEIEDQDMKTVKEGDFLFGDIKSGQINSIRFDESVNVEKGEEYFVEFSSSDLQEDESLQFYYDSQGNQQGDLEIIDEEIDGTMIVRTFTFCFDSETFIVVMGFALYLAVFFRILYKLFS